MSTSLKSCLILIAVVSGCIFVIVLSLMEKRSLQADLLKAAISGTLTLASAGALIWNHRRPDRAPDLLREKHRKYFDHEGFCFVITPNAADNMFWFHVEYQNRYENDCRAILALKPPRGFFLTRGKGICITLPLEIPGGACGELRVPIEIPPESLGKHCALDVAARVRYDRGRGRRLRFLSGMPVGRIEKPDWERLGLALNLLIAPTGSMAMSRPASIRFEVPRANYQSPPDTFVVKPRITWQPQNTAS